MQRLLTSILLLVYFTVSSGFVVNLHYCMGRLDSAVIGASEEEECGRCGMPTEEGNGCCRDEVKVVKLQADQLAAAAHYAVDAPPVVLPPLFSYDLLLVPPATEAPVACAHGPPLLDDSDRYLRHCVFRL